MASMDVGYFEVAALSVLTFTVTCCRWGEHEGHVAGSERSFDLYPPALDAGTLASRKSSSSTDSSSSHSLHSRSTTGSEGGAVSWVSLCFSIESYIAVIIHKMQPSLQKVKESKIFLFKVVVHMLSKAFLFHYT
jgi:hypothetical protein